MTTAWVDKTPIYEASLPPSPVVAEPQACVMLSVCCGTLLHLLSFLGQHSLPQFVAYSGCALVNADCPRQPGEW